MSTSHPANIDLAAALAEAQEQYRARNPRSLAIHEEACAALPGGNTRSAIYAEPFPLTMVRGDGAHLWDADGHEYVDFLSEFTAGMFGHSHPAIRRALDAALDGGWNMGAHGPAEARFAKAICDRFPSIDLVRFTNSGTEANLMAVAAARAITGRDKVLVFKGGYHGGLFYFRGKGSAVNAPYDFLVAPYNDSAATRALVAPHAQDLAAILIEPMLGGSGCIPATREFLADLRAARQRDRRDPDLRRGHDLAPRARRVAGKARHPAGHDDARKICRRRHVVRRVRRQGRADGVVRPAPQGRVPARRHVQQQRADDECRLCRADRGVHAGAGAGAQRFRRRACASG